jgi:hypothetical protein
MKIEEFCSDVDYVLMKALARIKVLERKLDESKIIIQKFLEFTEPHSTPKPSIIEKAESHLKNNDL